MQFPIFFKKSRGCYLYDEDGNKYLDFVGSWGPMVLGHSNKAIVNAIKKQASKAISFGAPTKNELEIAKIIKSYIPSIEKLRMVNSGTEATMSCIRLARGTTGRKKIIKFIISITKTKKNFSKHLVFNSKSICKNKILILSEASKINIYNYINEAIKKDIKAIITCNKIEMKKIKKEIPILYTKLLQSNINLLLNNNKL